MKFFKESEFVCDGVICFDKMNDAFIESLELARSNCDIPFVITSSYRTPEYNKKIGGKENSAHTKGMAVDISVKSSVDRFKIIDALFIAGFTRIGIGKDFVHVDNDYTKPQSVIWLY